MKKLLLTFTLLLAVAAVWAQTPTTFNYQAVVRGSDGILVQNSSVSLRFTIMVGSVTGTSVYVETHTVSTNQYGLVNVQIGDGTPVTGTFASILWGSDAHFIKIDLDVNGGSTFTEMNKQELIAVPYALHAQTVENSDNDESNEIQTVSKSGATITLSDGGGDVALDDDDATNELQTISLSSSTLTLSDGGGSVSINDADADPSNELQTISKSTSTVTLSDGGGNFTLNDDDATNELQTLSKSGNNLTLSDGGGTFSVADNDNNNTNEIQTLGLSGGQLTLSDGGGAVDLDDMSYWKKGTPGINYDSFVGIGTTTPASELVVASDSAIITLGHTGSSFNFPNSGMLRFTEGVEYGEGCGFQFNYNGQNNNFYLQRGCPSQDTFWAINRSGYMSIGSGTPQVGIMVNIESTQAVGLTVYGGSNATNGIVNAIDRAGSSSTLYGNLNTIALSGTQTGAVYANYTALSIASSGTIYGDYTAIANSGGGTSFGTIGAMEVTGTGNATVYGAYGQGYDFQTGTGTRTAYGLYAYGYVNSTNGTTSCYGVYAIAGGSADVEYAGYFSGDVHTTGAYNPSDIKLKTNVNLINSSLQKIMALNIYTYEYKNEEYSRMNLPEGIQSGFIAQELQVVFPELTKASVQPPMSELHMEEMEKNGVEIPANATEEIEFTAVNYAGLVPHLTKAIQEQQAMIAAQEEQLGSQSEEIAVLQAQLTQLIQTLAALEARFDQLSNDTE